QHFFINSRYVKTKTCFIAFEEGYKNTIMVGKFPYCILNITVPFNEVDVNVHPAKIEVRFSNEKSIFDAMYFAVKNTLHTISEIPQISLQPKSTISPFTLRNGINNMVQTSFEHKQVENNLQITPVKTGIQPQKQETQTLYNSYDKMTKDKNSLSSYSNIYSQSTKVNLDIEVGDLPADVAHHKIITPKNKTAFVIEERLPIENSIPAIQQDLPNYKQHFLTNYKIIGEAFTTYLILECEKELILIDKHAAHERLVYEALKSNTNTNQKQQLLEPITIRLSGTQYTALLEHTQLVSQMGFIIEDFGGFSVIIREIPMILVGADILSVVSELADKLSKNSKQLMPTVIDDIFHSIACRSAIKAGDQTQIEQMIALIKQLQGHEELKNCPHGRPIYTRLSLYELEKLFGRRG
ncbi:MAG: hypothetical protein RSB96_00495, partial [Oscillospiraceae bacterium]